MRIVLDTCILISSLITKGTPLDIIYQAWRNKHFTLITSNEQLDELSRVIQYKKLKRFIKVDEGKKLVEILSQWGTVVGNIPTVKYSPDLDDNAIIATAIAGNASYIVSGDKNDLLALKTVEEINIITARQCVERLQDLRMF